LLEARRGVDDPADSDEEYHKYRIRWNNCG
jgi:hypothetical protein